MAALTDFITVVKAWVDDLNPTDALITSWVRIGEERMNNELRVDEMIVREYATFDDDCAVLPADWLKTIYVKPQGGRAFTFVSNKGYFDGMPGQPALVAAPPGGFAPYPPTGHGYYTNVGRTIFVWPPVDPDALTKFDIAYYAKVPPLGDTSNDVMDRFPSLYLNCTLAAGAPYLIEDDRLNTFAALATAGIKMANDQAVGARFSGSPIVPVKRSFG
jgi:hypothetical protein